MNRSGAPSPPETSDAEVQLQDPSPSGHDSSLRYDVFLSFNAADTRRYFTDYLYHALAQKGILAFQDDDELERGDSLSLKITKAIEESRFVFIIVSTNYARSTRCLDELVKAFDCRKVTPKKVIIPVFYDVKPIEVRRRIGKFGEAFSKHTDAFIGNTETVQKWEKALTNLADISGWDLRNYRNGAKAIEDIVHHIFVELNSTALNISRGLVAMDSRLEKVLSYLDLSSLTSVLKIGICGMGGIGKTVIAREVFARIRSQFECCSFLGNVREATIAHGAVRLQEQLLRDTIGSTANIYDSYMGISIIRRCLRRKKVLIVVDDVTDIQQLELLCDDEWFGAGSRIIITSRNKHVLEAFGVLELYDVEPLDVNEALQLFSLTCFKKDQVEEDYQELSKMVVDYAGGLPVAIQVLGSFLHSRSVGAWSSTLRRLERQSLPAITDVLRVSFDGLTEHEKQVFLDIACFFKGEDHDRVTRILESCGFFPRISIEILIKNSLVTIAGGKLSMHNLIQDMGWNIVRRECLDCPGKRSRLWHYEDIIDVLEHHKATAAIEGIFLNLPEQEDVHLTSNPFPEMRRLRFLKVHNVNFYGNLEYLSNELRLLDWHSYPLKSLPSNFQANWLVELIMHSSHIKQLWSGVKHCGMLKLIDLRYSEYLTETPDLSGVPELEMLVLEGCTSLVKVHPSVGFLEKLALLNMRNCISVKRLPPLRSTSLKVLCLSGCSRMKFPEIVGSTGCLLELDLGGTAIAEVPESIERFTALTLLNLEDCKNLHSLPSSIRSITSLETINVTGCSKLTEVPENLGSLERLEELSTSGTAEGRNRMSPPLPPWYRMSPPLLPWYQHLRFIDWVFPSFSSLLSSMDPKLLDWFLMEGEIPDYGSLSLASTSTLSYNNTPVGLQKLLVILLVRSFMRLYLNFCSLLMVFQNQSMESTSSVSATTSRAYFTESLPLTHHIEEIVKPDEERRGKEAAPVSSELYSPIEKLQEENEIDNRNVEESVVIEEDKSSPEHLQGLFLYCSLFPDDFEFRKHELVQLWIAGGLDMKETEQETMEDAGIKHFNALESRRFFLQSKRDFQMDFDSVFSVPLYSPSSFFYKVNPVELSLLENRSSTEYFKGVDGKLDRASETTKHLSLIHEDIDEMIFGVLEKFKNLRTLLLLSGHGSSIKRVPASLFLSLPLLTTLNLSRTLISGLPSSIGDAQLLRYIDLSYTLIIRLPESIGSLNKLQTLKLRGCKDLFDLPRSMHRLTALRHLDFDIIRQLDYMPAHLGSLSNLQSLSAFLVGGDDGRRIQELKNLNDLRGALRIFRLENVSSKADAEDVDLKSKKRLQRLDLRWTKLMGENNEMQDDILESLQPPQGLKELQILFFSGSKLPSWLSNTSITDLVLITLYKCANCELLPSLGRLPKLKFLSIVEMNKVIEIDGTFFRSSDHTESFKAFPELEILEIDIMLNLKEWKEVKEGDLESLIKLTMESCPELVTVPSLSCLKKLKYIEFNHCPKLASFDCNALPTLLESLIIRDCPELKEWFQEEGHQDLGKLKSCS